MRHGRDCDCDYCVTEREFRRIESRQNNLRVCKVWMERDGLEQEAEHLRRLINEEPLAYFWAIVYVNKTLDGQDKLQVFLLESKAAPLLEEAAWKVLGRLAEEDELFLIRGPFHWPDAETFEGVLAEVMLETDT